MENEYINVPGGLELPKGEEVRFLNYLEEYLLNKEKKNPNIKLGKIDLPGFTIFGIHEIILISRNFGFIERLVREGKIDYWSEGWRNTPNYYESSEFGQKIVNDIERLIIHLSIIDQPIEYLCSILKEQS